MSFDTIINEVTAEISTQMFLRIEKGTERPRKFTFTSNANSLKSLDRQLKNFYGNKEIDQVLEIVKEHINEEDTDTVEVRIRNNEVTDVTDVTYKKDLKEAEEILSEFEAEVVNNMVPFKKVLSNGKQIPEEKLKQSEIGKTINTIVGALKKQNLIKNFNKDDMSSLDISSGTKGVFNLTDDQGNKYIFKISTGRIEKV